MANMKRSRARLANERWHGAHHRADGDDAADGARRRRSSWSATPRHTSPATTATARKRCMPRTPAVERVVQDLLLIPRWNDILAGTAQSGFVDGAMTSTKTLPGGGHDHALLRTEHRDRPAPGGNRHGEPVGREQPAVEALRLGSAPGHAAGLSDRQPDVLAVWVADDPPTAPTSRTPTAIPWSTPTAR